MKRIATKHMDSNDDENFVNGESSRFEEEIIDEVGDDSDDDSANSLKYLYRSTIIITSL